MKVKLLSTIFGSFLIVGCIFTGMMLVGASPPFDTTPGLVRIQTDNLTNMISWQVTLTGTSVTSLTGTAITDNYATVVSAAMTTAGVINNTSMVYVGATGMTASGGGYQIIPYDFKGYQLPLAADKLRGVIGDGSGTQKLQVTALIR